jgi:hypothetical protein
MGRFAVHEPRVPHHIHCRGCEIYEERGRTAQAISLLFDDLHHHTNLWDKAVFGYKVTHGRDIHGAWDYKFCYKFCEHNNLRIINRSKELKHKREAYASK